MNIQTKGPVAFGLLRMMQQHPFYAVFIDRWRVIPDESIGTMGVTLARDLTVELHYAPTFVESITADELVGVLLHEVHHVLFGHLSLRPEDYPDAAALVIAEEVTANEFITAPLPGAPVTLASYPKLPPHESTDQRYERLAQSRRAQKRQPIDSHDLWALARSVAPGVIDAVVAGDMRAALDQLPADLRTKAAAGLRELLSTQFGDQPGSTVFAVVGGGHSTTNWPGVLRSFVWHLTHPSPCYHRPSRRLPHLVGVVPGRARVGRRPRVMAALDTSGSMIDDAILTKIRTEVHALHALAEIVVVECDTQVTREYEYTGEIMEVKGGGGTSFVQPLSKEFLAQRRIDAVLYFTDGMGQAPVEKPPIPVLWCLVGEAARSPVSWGRSINLGPLR